MKFDHSLDCMGLLCPMPVVNTALKLEEMKEGEVLEIISDDKGIKKDMPAWCEATGQEYLGLEEKGNEVHVFVKKKS